eukprot:scaffold130770_cov32-Tisochrysis_lutea.AAC.5
MSRRAVRTACSTICVASTSRAAESPLAEKADALLPPPGSRAQPYVSTRLRSAEAPSSAKIAAAAASNAWCAREAPKIYEAYRLGPPKPRSKYVCREGGITAFVGCEHTANTLPAFWHGGKWHGRPHPIHTSHHPNVPSPLPSPLLLDVAWLLLNKSFHERLMTPEINQSPKHLLCLYGCSSQDDECSYKRCPCTQQQSQLAAQASSASSEVRRASSVAKAARRISAQWMGSTIVNDHPEPSGAWRIEEPAIRQPHARAFFSIYRAHTSPVIY